MTRAALEHIIRASGTIADVDDIVVIESQAVARHFSGHSVITLMGLTRPAREETTPLDPEIRSLVFQRIQSDFAGV
jgi:hypothetical protein